MSAGRCDSTVLMGDDRGAALTLRCELEPDHQSEHCHHMAGCRPTAFLTWLDEYEPPAMSVGVPEADK